MHMLKNPYITCEYGGLFQSKESWCHPDRVETTYELIYITEGEVYMNIGGEEHRFQKGELLILEPNVRHFGFRESEDVSFYWVHFRLEGETLPFRTRWLESFEHAYLFKELLHNFFLPSRPDYVVDSILLRILAEICYLDECEGKKLDKDAEAISEWICANISAKLRLGSVAAHFGFSTDHVTRVLKKQYGVGAKGLMDRFIILKAKNMLANTGKYVKEIGYELGFGSDNAFISFFRYHEGISPSEFRDNFYKIHMNNH